MTRLSASYPRLKCANDVFQAPDSLMMLISDHDFGSWQTPIPSRDILNDLSSEVQEHICNAQLLLIALSGDGRRSILLQSN